MALFNEVIYTICWNATRGMSPEQDISALLPVAESLWPSISQKVGELAAGSERKRSLLKRTKTLTVTNGTATLDDDVLTAYLEDSTLYDPADLTKTYGWIRNWNDFINPGLSSQPFANYGRYSVSGGVTFGQVEPGAVFDPSSGFTGSMTLNIPCVPVKPATQTTALDVPDEILNDIYEIGSEMLRGLLLTQAASQAA